MMVVGRGRLRQEEKINQHSLLMRIWSLIPGILLIFNVTQSQWVTRNSGVNATLRDVDFVDSLHGWSVGDSATIISTTDGGDTWTRQFESIDTVEFLFVQFIDRNHGFVGGNKITTLPTYQTGQAVILTTTDGGDHWEEVALGFGLGYRFATMYFRNTDLGWIGINNNGASGDRRGVLLKTENGGQSWDTEIDTTVMIGAVTFDDDTTGYSFWSVAFDNFDDTDVLRTTDGGNSWVTSGSIQDIVRAAITLTPAELWTVGYTASHTVDSGKSWESMNIIPGSPFITRDGSTFGAQDVIVVGAALYSGIDFRGMIVRTRNSGISWEKDVEMAGIILHSVSVSGTFAWVTGSDGLIMSNNDITTAVSELDEFDNGRFSIQFELNNYPNPFNPSTQILYSLPSASDVSLRVFNILGVEIATLVDGKAASGKNTATWNADGLPGGIYFYRLVAGDFSETRKMVLLK